jgi:hypothetical protein
MKFEEEYKRMNENITPKDELKRETAKRMSEESERKTARFRVIRGAAAVAACLAVTVGAMGVLGAFSGKAPAEDQAEGKQPQTVQTDPSGAVLPGPGGTITYSSLGLDLGNVEYPDMPGDSQACLMPFSEDMIMDSKLIIKGTVENVRFNKYFENQTTAVYEVRVDEVLYSEKDVKAGDLVLVEQNLYMFTSIQDSVVGLKPGGQYILPIFESDYDRVEDFRADSDILTGEARDKGYSVVVSKELESAYGIIYPYLPQIQAVPGKGYLFPSNWVSLATEDASEVILDVNSESQGYFEKLLFRDESLITDYKALIEKYVSEDYRAEHKPVIDSGLEIADGKVKTTEGLAFMYADNSIREQELIYIDFKCEQDASTGEWVVTYKTEKSGDVTIRVPEYIELPAGEALIGLARAGLAEPYASMQASVDYDPAMESFEVRFAGEDGSAQVTAVFNILGTLNNYVIFE